MSRPSNDTYRQILIKYLVKKKEQDELKKVMNNLNVIKKKEFLEIKNCSICKKSLSLDNFYLSHNGQYNFCCIPCDKRNENSCIVLKIKRKLH